jgi:heat shock protein HslJ
MTKRVLAWLVALLLVLAACGDDGDANDPGLDGETFLSVSVRGHELVPGSRIRLSFDDGRLGADAGCNSLGSDYDVVDGRLVLRGDLTTTDMGCDSPLLAQDEWLADLLRSEPRLERSGDVLTVTTADVTVDMIDRRVADPDRPLSGTRWRVDTVIQAGTASSVPADHPVVVEIDDAGILVATAQGCTSARLDVDVDVDDGVLRFGEFVVDAIGCPPPWSATIEVLRAGEASYSITAARLTVTAGEIGVSAVADG